MTTDSGNFSNELCACIASHQPKERERNQAMKQVAGRYAAAIQLSDEQLKLLVQQALVELEQTTTGLNVNLKQSPFVRQAQDWSNDQGQAQGHGQNMQTQTVHSLQFDAVSTTTDIFNAAEAAMEAVSDDAVVDVVGSAERALAASDIQAMLTAGIQDISNSLVDEFSLNDVLRIILETMYRAMGFERVLLCLRDAKTHTMVGRFGFGTDTAEVASKVRFQLKEVTDVFSVAALKGVDLLITDVNDPKISDRVPPWHRQHLLAETFVLFPLLLKEKPVAMIYCDKRKAGEIVISPSELSLLKTLRNQAVLAIKQAN